MHSREPLQRIVLANLDDTDRLGQRLAEHLPGGACVGLIGTLGAGKTRLVQAILAAYGVDRRDVTSPTFSLLRSYETAGHTIHHLDAYRINDEDEFLELGVEDLWEDPAAVVLIEWAGRVTGCLPRSTLWIEIEWTDSERRYVAFRGPAEQWAERVSRVAAGFATR